MAWVNGNALMCVWRSSVCVCVPWHIYVLTCMRPHRTFSFKNLAKCGDVINQWQNQSWSTWPRISHRFGSHRRWSRIFLQDLCHTARTSKGLGHAVSQQLYVPALILVDVWLPPVPVLVSLENEDSIYHLSRFDLIMKGNLSYRSYHCRDNSAPVTPGWKKCQKILF